MKNRFLARFNSWAIYGILTLVVTGVIMSSYLLINYLRKEEIRRIELFATAMKYQQESDLASPETLDLILQISKSNTSVPVIVTDAAGKPLGPDLMKNIPETVMADPAKLQALLMRMKSSYKPFELKLPGGNQYVYYTNSRLLNNLKYGPIYLGICVLAYALFSLWFFQTAKKTDEGFVWAGLAKETAHQIGTPLSSMIGWIEILKMQDPSSEGIREIERDILRLQTITERFSKIGSVPELNDINLSETLKITYEYLKTRISSKVLFEVKMPAAPLLIPHNRILISWVVENLVKNAVDAMKGEGTLVITAYEKNHQTVLEFRDTGSGMTILQAAKVFRPGFSTKKRGWGLGLSLAKRVVEEYHSGDLKVAQTEPGKGTTFRITLKNPQSKAQ